MAAANTLQTLQEEATCPICLGHFKDPVITPCGHNFCRACIEGCLEGGPDAAPCCPQCRECCCRADLRPNRQLQSMVELVRQLSVQLETPPRGEGLCEQHQEKLKLFCQEDHKLICVICQVSREHQKHTIQPITEAAQEYQVKLQNWAAPLKKKKDAIVVSKQKEEEEYKALRKNLEDEKVKTAAEFERLLQTLREQEQTILGRLEEMGRKLTVVEDANLAKLSSEISSLDALIKEIETKCKQPSEELLKNVGLLVSRCENVRFDEPKPEMDEKKKIIKTAGQLTFYPSVPVMLDSWAFRDLRTSVPLGSYKGIVPAKPIGYFQNQAPTGSYYKGIVPAKPIGYLQNQVPMGSYKAVVTLDSETAHQSLVLSENLKRVTYSPQSSPLRAQMFSAHSPKRFTASPCVLGSEGFTSGRHYWEVQLLQEGRGWTVGVARESINRTLATHLPRMQSGFGFKDYWSYPGSFGQVFTGSPNEGLWAVHKNNNQYCALTSPCTTLKPHQPLKKLGVYLDYEGGQVFLYNGDTMEELYTYSGASFNGKVYPYFNLCGINGAGFLHFPTDLRLV